MEDYIYHIQYMAKYWSMYVKANDTIIRLENGDSDTLNNMTNLLFMRAFYMQSYRTHRGLIRHYLSYN